jgi:peptidylprolyl isomerase
MRLIAALLFTATAVAQTPTKPATTSPATPHPAARVAACTKLFEISPKVPALPATAPCARPLYTLTTVSPVKLENVSPMEGPELLETLGIETSSFTLAYVDTKVGTGALAAPHKWYTINYTGYLTDGTKFDSSFNPGRDPFTIQIGAHGVIPGWDTGFSGMRVGGKRRLFIPWQLAYSTRGNPPTIPAKANLVFDVELLAQNDKEPAAKTPPTPPTPPTAPASAQPSAQPAGTPTSATPVAPAKPQPSATPAPTPAPATPAAPATPPPPATTPKP